MTRPEKALLFATALVVGMSCAGSIAQAGPSNEKWIRGTSGKVFSTARGPGVLKSLDEGRTWTTNNARFTTTPTAARTFSPTLLPGRPVKVYY